MIQNFTPRPQFYESGQAIQREAVVDLLIARGMPVGKVVETLKKAEAMALAGESWFVTSTVAGDITCRRTRRGEVHKDGSPMSDPVEPPKMIARQHINVEKWQDGLRPDDPDAT
jgi:hypothetical protein